MKFINDGVIPAEKVFYTLQNMLDTFEYRKIERNHRLLRLLRDGE